MIWKIFISEAKSTLSSKNEQGEVLFHMANIHAHTDMHMLYVFTICSKIHQAILLRKKKKKHLCDTDQDKQEGTDWLWC